MYACMEFSTAQSRCTEPKVSPLSAGDRATQTHSSEITCAEVQGVFTVGDNTSLRGHVTLTKDFRSPPGVRRRRGRRGSQLSALGT